ncbi:MAG: carbon-nitrogen hydrolase family protein [Candidatus Thorarchaeota archaeon]|nr:MAG: carbon-nitrogen hydrolase family protein [Candidatus Thorarchaeota archaeon]
MKAAIISNLVKTDILSNQTRMLQLASEAVKRGARFIVFTEAAATGLVNSGNPETDYLVAETIPGPRNEEWRDFAIEHSTYFAAGLLERERNRIFDSAVLYDPQGNLILHYRRNDPGWHLPEDNPSVYCEGLEIPVIDSKIGKLAFLICGDLWNDKVLEKLKIKNPDYLLYLFARNFIPDGSTESTWKLVLSMYKERWLASGTNVLAANLLSEYPQFESIGGTWYFNKDGQVITESPILHEGILIIELEETGYDE